MCFFVVMKLRWDGGTERCKLGTWNVLRAESPSETETLFTLKWKFFLMADWSLTEQRASRTETRCWSWNFFSHHTEIEMSSAICTRATINLDKNRLVSMLCSVFVRKIKSFVNGWENVFKILIENINFTAKCASHHLKALQRVSDFAEHYLTFATLMSCVFDLTLLFSFFPSS